MDKLEVAKNQTKNMSTESAKTFNAYIKMRRPSSVIKTNSKLTTTKQAMKSTKVQKDSNMGMGIESLPNPVVKIYPIQSLIVESLKIPLVGNLVKVIMGQSQPGLPHIQAQAPGSPVENSAHSNSKALLKPKPSPPKILGH